MHNMVTLGWKRCYFVAKISGIKKGPSSIMISILKATVHLPELDDVLLLPEIVAAQTLKRCTSSHLDLLNLTQVPPQHNPSGQTIDLAASRPTENNSCRAASA
jgi:hypothetical protein